MHTQGVKRLSSKFEENFFNPHLSVYAKMIIKNCFICQANKHRTKTRRGDYTNQVCVIVDRPGVFWFSNVIQIVSNSTSNINSILTFSCGYSAYVVAIPFEGDMTNDMFLRYFEERFLMIFLNTKVVLTDNAANIVKQALHNLNIQLLIVNHICRNPTWWMACSDSKSFMNNL